MELLRRRVALLVLLLGACGAPTSTPRALARIAHSPQIAPSASGSSIAAAAASPSAANAGAPESAPPRRAHRLAISAERAWSPSGNRLAFDGGIVDLPTKNVTPFECKYPRWISDGYVVCETTGVLAMEVDTGRVRSLPCKGYPSYGWDHYVACADDDVVVMDIATGNIRHIPIDARVVTFSGPGHILELGYGSVQRWDFDASAPLGSPYDVPTGPTLSTSRDQKFGA